MHADGAISLGIVVTKGASLHANVRGLVERFVQERQIASLDDISKWGDDPTSRQRQAISSP